MYGDLSLKLIYLKAMGVKDGDNLLAATIDQVLTIVPKTKKAEAEAPIITFGQKIAGIRPDIKKRIQGKTEEFDEFLDVAKARNFDDTLDSALSHASKSVIEVRDILNKKLSDTGQGIGKFRKKLETIKANPEEIQKTIAVLSKQVEGKGLTINDKNKLVQAKGRETIFSDREIVELQGMLDSLLRLKGDPKSLRIIDNRINIDKKIKFAKSAREISNELDPIARAVRNDLARINREIVGVEQSAQLKRFSELNDLMDDLSKLTSKGQNAEFLLKRVLSERDRLPKEVLKAIKEETGIDLLDKAQFAQIVTELVGNPQTTGLFRQEIEKAGLSVVSLLNPKIGAFTTLLEKLPGVKGKAEEFVEKQFREATKTELTPTRTPKPQAKTKEQVLKEEFARKPQQGAIEKRFNDAKARGVTTFTPLEIGEFTALRKFPEPINPKGKHKVVQAFVGNDGIKRDFSLEFEDGKLISATHNPAKQGSIPRTIEGPIIELDVKTSKKFKS